MRTLIAAALLLPAPCGHDSTAPGGTLQLDAAQAVAARIGSAGELRAHRSRSLDFARDDSGVRRRTRTPS